MCIKIKKTYDTIVCSADVMIIESLALHDFTELTRFPIRAIM